MRTLTVKQAISEGYTHCGYDGRDYQGMISLDSMTAEDFNDAIRHGEKFVLAEKEPTYFAIAHSELMDFITDQYHDHEQFQLDDTNEAEEIVRTEERYFLEVAEKINSMFESHPFYTLTDIYLTW